MWLDGVPTSVDFVRDDHSRIVTSYTSAACVLFDLETTKAVTRLDTDQVRSIKSIKIKLYSLLNCVKSLHSLEMMTILIKFEHGY